MKATDVLADLKSLANSERAKNNQWFFKTGKGEYGEGDQFWGLTVPQVRSVVKQYKDLSLNEIVKLLHHKVHEVRLCAVLLLVAQYKNNPDLVYKTYLENTKYINNWDLVDCSAGYIVGPYLEHKDKDILTTLAHSNNVWERRIAMISTFYYIYNGHSQEALRIAEILVNDKHDLIQKAVGWMLREIGKRCSIEEEEVFLKKYAATMPRTALRYAIERFTPEKKSHYMNLHKNLQ